MKKIIIKTLSAISSNKVSEALAEQDFKALFKQLQTPEESIVQILNEYLILLTLDGEKLLSGQIVSPGSNGGPSKTIISYKSEATKLPGLPKKLTLEVQYGDMKPICVYEFIYQFHQPIIYGKYISDNDMIYAIQAQIYEY